MTTSVPADDLLEHDLARLIELDGFRTQFANWRKRGREALKQFIQWDEGGQPPPPKIQWQKRVERRHRAQVVKALCRRGEDLGAIQPFLGKLRQLKPEEILGKPEQSPLFETHPTEGSLELLDAAHLLDVLASAPEASFSAATMYYYYIVLRELYYPTPPVWIVGGARAGKGGYPTAFVTSQFVRSILSFARMLERTGQYFGALAELPQTATTAQPEWNQQDRTRRALSLYISLERGSWNLALTLPKRVPKLDGSDRAEFEAAVRHDIVKALREARKTFVEVRRTVKKFRTGERIAATTPARKHLIDRSAGAHAVASRALLDAIVRARKSLRLFEKLPDNFKSLTLDEKRAVRKKAKELPDANKLLFEEERRTFAKQLKDLERHFGDTADAVRMLIRPARDYLWNVLDAQLALATADSGGATFEPMEMAAAAATLGAEGKQWDDERLQRAAKYLTAAVGRDGFTIGKPFHTAGGVSYFQPSQQQVLAAYAQILEHVESELSPVVLKRLAHYFSNTRTDLGDDSTAWRWTHADPKPSEHSAAQTAFATLALDRICRMPDRRINDIVLRHFNRKTPTLGLDQLFYPDYGLVTLLGSDSQRVPIAIALERMRAHISGITLGQPYSTRLYSAVFHGPPGTGKTTLMEALAKSAGVPFVEVTPSDIVMHGTDAVERRARAVLRALSFLTRAVVIFDEFDSVLQTRAGEGAPQSILTFLTPNMLPKLKTLYDAAKDRGVAFALATNVLKKLDRAAIRSGRFDATIGVYPPDVLSRYGRLYTEVQRFIDKTGTTVPAELPARFAEAVRGSRGWSMQDIGRPGWFTAPAKKSLQSDTLFHFLFEGGRLPNLSGLGTDRALWSEEEIKEWEMIETLEQRDGGLASAIQESLQKTVFTPRAP